jgi:predicted ArsR family transcriptional regulator
MDVPADEPAADPSIRAVAALDDQLRRRMYEVIRDSGVPLTREQAGAAVGISRKLAAFHLDKLVEVGLLRASDAPSGGIARVGRRPKVYQPAELDVRVHIPPRQHDQLAEVLIDAVLTEADEENAWQAALRVARARGHSIGAATIERARPGRLGAERALNLAETALRHWGYEPTRPTPDRLRLRNCPFHPLAAKAPALVCGINHAFLAGFLTGLNTNGVRAELDPNSGECCVQLHANYHSAKGRRINKIG